MRYRKSLGLGLIWLVCVPTVASASPEEPTNYEAPSGALAPAPSWRAIWPVTPAKSGYPSPVAAARGFAVSLLHMRGPVLGIFSSRSATTGVVAVRYATASYPINVHVARFTGASGWWVISCTTSQIDITWPVALSHVTSPLTLTGRSLAFEAVVNIALYVDGRATALVRTTTMGGGTQMAPFGATLHFPTGLRRNATLVMFTTSMKDGYPVVASARRLILQ